MTSLAEIGLTEDPSLKKLRELGPMMSTYYAIYPIELQLQTVITGLSLKFSASVIYAEFEYFWGNVMGGGMVCAQLTAETCHFVKGKGFGLPS